MHFRKHVYLFEITVLDDNLLLANQLGLGTFLSSYQFRRESLDRPHPTFVYLPQRQGEDFNATRGVGDRQERFPGHHDLSAEGPAIPDVPDEKQLRETIEQVLQRERTKEIVLFLLSTVR